MSLIGRIGLLGVLALAATCSAGAVESSVPFTPAGYAKGGQSKGVVLFAANWSRRWKCGAFANAQLQSLSFDRKGALKENASTPADLIAEDSSFFPANRSFTDHAYIVEPGEYLFSGFKIKAAKSVSDVGYFAVDRSTLIADEKSKAGQFSVAAGEIVYIGHFAVDCAGAPMPWRFYPEDRQSFEQYLASARKKFDGLPTEKAVFRLLDTTVMGHPFVLP
jgi:hypothetical protein